MRMRRVFDWSRKKHIREGKRQAIGEIKKNMETIKVTDKIQEIKTQIQKVTHKQLQQTQEKMKTDEMPELEEASLGVLLVRLHWSSIAAATDETKKKDMPALAESYGTLIKDTADKLNDHMEQVNQEGAEHRILHHVNQYEHILREVFPEVGSDSKRQEQDTKRVTTSEATPADEDQIREIIDKIKRDILSDVLMVINDNLSKQATKTSQQLTQEDRSEKKQEAGVPGGQGPPTPTVEEPEKKGQLDTAASDKANDQTDKVPEKNTETLDAFIKETIHKVQRYIQPRIERQLVINGIVDKIKTHLQSQKTLVIILKVDHKYVTEWEQTRNALSLLLPRVAIVMILKKTDNVQKRAKEEYCDPPEEPIDYSSLSAIYHDIVLEITSQQKNRGNYDPQIFRTILEQCEPYEFCMKVFAHTLYAKPKKSKEELHKLQSDLQELSPKSSRNSATKMLKFSYRDLPKEYKSCFLYLAIFPRGHQIRRSTLIGRWVAEGLITTEDWRWSTSVHKAEKCFDALINKWLIYPAEISATGRVKSCTVGDLVHEFITKIAKKQRIVETRLSHHLARHFSIFNDVHLRGSDKIDKFLERLSGSHQWCRLKVLDLEGCKCFEKKRRYLKNICNNISLLKYLSLRETDITWLPSEINNLRELEVLDIRQTKVAKSATKGLLLLKLKRLLAGHTNPSGDAGTSFPSHVLIPEKIEKMLDMEVLSNVKAQSSQDLKDIGKLWQLSKLGVVIEDKDHHKNLLQAISNLHECLRSLSITIEISKDSPKALGPIEQKKKHYVPKVLERLNITGIVVDKDLLDLLATSKTPLTKVTLSKTSLSRTVLELLSNSLPELCSLRLRHNTYTDDKLTFMKGEFQKLKYFLVEGSNNIEISFDNAAAPELEKIVLSFSNLQHINGVEHLSKLQELELITSTKSTNNNGGITGLADAAPSTPTIPDHLAAITATDHTPAAASAATPAVNDPAPSTAATANLAPSAPAASSPAPTNDPVPSAATTTGTPHSAPTTTSAAGTISPPSAPTTAAPTAAGANDPPVPSSTTATCPTPSAPSSTTTATIPSSSTSTTSNNNRVLFSKLLSDAKM
ncbi:hypothetical protein BS78_K072200 [Paspalum vaginatum]|uniref:NB-ARC domain-containing protein n=1 Tax=Paspalum vaginatum TaxID=158149 RepID=A0A9W8CDQ3_9POAL|nr:hypothetical protein BS78_K072200 [Paspalum vaginatum]